jgi:hypothetical protein
MIRLEFRQWVLPVIRTHESRERLAIPFGAAQLNLSDKPRQLQVEPL